MLASPSKPLARVRVALAACSLVAGASMIAVVGAPPPAGAYPTSTVELDGHGFGHGRGMGQYGALGYALNSGFSYSQILQHYYSNTTVGDIGNPQVTVIMRAFDGADTVVQQPKGHMTTNAAVGSFQALRVAQIGSNTFRVDSGPSCAGPWTTVRASVSGPVNLDPQVRNDDLTEMLEACEPSGNVRWLRGEIQAVTGLDGTSRTINNLDMQSYLQGVVPRESPASWGDLGNGAGMNELKAQAVAARSYAQASNLASYAKTCDTTDCQVYGGRAVQTGGSFFDLEDARSNAAVAATSGEVRILNGNVALTEYSSSTGGWTAGGTFPAVVDDGDAVSQNPFHNWHASIPVSQVEGAFPAIGSLNTIVVTQRNGLGDQGGRVLQMQLQGTKSTSTISGDAFAAALNLRSNWFAVSGAPAPAGPARGPGNGPLAIRGDQIVASRPDAAAVRGNERVDVVLRTSSGFSWIFWNGSGWSGYTNLGAPPSGATGDPTVVSWAPGRLDVFVRGANDNKLWQIFSTDGGATWSPWIKPLGDDGTLASPPQADSRGPGRLDVWVTGTDNQLYQRFYDGQWNAGWIPSGRPPAGITGDPTSASQDINHVDVFVRGGDDKLWQKSWNGSSWSGWSQPVGSNGTLASSPDAASGGTGSLFVFVRGTDGGVYGVTFSSGRWVGWTRMAGADTNTPASPGVTSRGPNRYDIFVQGTDNRLYQIWQ